VQVRQDVVANRLTEDPETTVLLLEAGNPATKPEIQVPLSWTSLLGSEVDWAYFTEPEPYLNGRKIFIYIYPCHDICTCQYRTN
jgi:choline dehydrogenase